MSDSEDEATGKDKVLKVVLLGDGTAGKTSITTRFSQNHFGKSYQQTMGLDFFLKRIILSGDINVTLKVWNIGGQTIGGRMLDNYIYGCHVVMFVYDITNYSSFENLDDWFTVIKRECFKGDAKPPHMALVANKMNMEHMRTVQRERHIKYVQECGMSSHFVSAKSNDMINSCFMKVAAEVVGVKLTAGDIQNVTEDYTHLVRVLSTHFCKSCKSQSGGADKWTVTESTRLSIKNTVSQIMSKCSIYSRESDSELGLLD